MRGPMHGARAVRGGWVAMLVLTCAACSEAHIAADAGSHVPPETDGAMPDPLVDGGALAIDAQAPADAGCTGVLCTSAAGALECRPSGPETQCGRACEPCPSAAHAIAECDAFDRCTLECDVGYVREGDACVEAGLVPPRPIAPLSTQRTSTQRPTLRAQIAPGTDGALVEVCADRACTDVIWSARTRTGVVRPERALGAGVRWVRWRGMRSDSVGARASASWQLVLPRVDREADLAWGFSRDLDGDGYDEVVTSGSEVRVHRGSVSGPEPSPALVLPGGDASIVGDLDGDGLAELVRSTEGFDQHIFVAYGRAVAGEMREVELVVPEGTGTFGWLPGARIAAGDLDGDGFGELAIGCELCAGRQGQVYVYPGSERGLASSPIALTSPLAHSYNYFGRSMGGAFDVDGDGYGDLAIASPGSPTGVFVFRGGPTGVMSGAPPWGGPSRADVSWTSELPLRMRVGMGADLDGDGRAELNALVAGASGGEVRTVLGAAIADGTLLDASTAVASAWWEVPYEGLDDGPFVAGDLDGDGRLDRVHAIPSGTDAIAELADIGWGYFTVPAGTTRIRAAGDVNGDGLADLLYEGSTPHVLVSTGCWWREMPRALGE